MAAESILGRARMMSLRLPQHLPENVLPSLCQIRGAATMPDSIRRRGCEDNIRFCASHFTRHTSHRDLGNNFRGVQAQANEAMDRQSVQRYCMKENKTEGRPCRRYMWSLAGSINLRRVHVAERRLRSCCSERENTGNRTFVLA